MSKRPTTNRMFGGIAAGVALAAVLAVPAAVANEKMGSSTEMMAKMDSNHDGSVSMAEHDAYAKSMFEKMDANHDGSVTKAEMDAGMKKMHDDHMKHDRMEHDSSMKQDDTSRTNDGTSGQ
jgi:hypothetical protein